MAKRVRLSDSFNPVYPYEEENTSHSFINPGFISSDGFTQNPQGVLTLKCITPLTTTGGSLQLKVGGGLAVDNTDGTLEEDITTIAPISKNKHTVGLSIGYGLQTQDSKLCVNLGNGLKISNNSICLDHDINTLWTGINPSANCQIMHLDETNDGKLTLVLVKNGGLVNGYVSLVGASDTVNQLFMRKTANIQVRLYFNSSGALLTDLSDLKNSLNYKSGPNMAIGTVNDKSFMPSIKAYPFNNANNGNYIHGTCYYMTSYDKSLFPLSIAVWLNGRMSSANVAYAIQIDWTLNSDQAPETTQATLVTSPFSFSYIREDDD